MYIEHVNQFYMDRDFLPIKKMINYYIMLYNLYD